jgi:hypothetical protein
MQSEENAERVRNERRHLDLMGMNGKVEKEMEMKEV